MTDSDLLTSDWKCKRVSKYRERFYNRMTGKTHIAVGIAASLFVTQPENVGKVVVCGAVAAIGAVVSDIDVCTSESSRDLNKIIGISVITAAIVTFLDYQWHFGIINYLKSNNTIIKGLLSAAAFIAVCAFGKTQPHRSFLHSILAVILLSGIIYMNYPTITPYFTVAMISHILIDCLNYINVRLLYPFKGGISLDLCHADGPISDLFFLCGSIMAAGYAIATVLQTRIPFL